MWVYEDDKLADTALWTQAQDDFRDFTEDDFRAGTLSTVRKLRTALRLNGVYVLRGLATNDITIKGMVDFTQQKEPVV